MNVLYLSCIVVFCSMCIVWICMNYECIVWCRFTCFGNHGAFTVARFGRGMCCKSLAFLAQFLRLRGSGSGRLCRPMISPSKAQTLQGWRISVLSTGLLSIAVSLLVSNLAMQGFEYHLLRFSDPPLLHDMYNCVCISSLQPQVGVGAALFVSPGIHLHPREKVALAMREPPREAPLPDLEQGTRQTLIYNVYHLVGLVGSR